MSWGLRSQTRAKRKSITAYALAMSRPQMPRPGWTGPRRRYSTTEERDKKARLYLAATPVRHDSPGPKKRRPGRKEQRETTGPRRQANPSRRSVLRQGACGVQVYGLVTRSRDRQAVRHQRKTVHFIQSHPVVGPATAACASPRPAHGPPPSVTQRATQQRTLAPQQDVTVLHDEIVSASRGRNSPQADTIPIQRERMT